jgi:hypothetical protein
MSRKVGIYLSIYAESCPRITESSVHLFFFMYLNLWKLSRTIWYSSNKQDFVFGELANIRSASRVTGHLSPNIVFILGSWYMWRCYSKVGVFLIWKLEFEQTKASWKPQIKPQSCCAALKFKLSVRNEFFSHILTWCVCA